MPVIIDVSPELRNIPGEKGGEAPKFSSDESFNNCMKRFDQFLAKIDLLFDQYEKSLINLHLFIPPMFQRYNKYFSRFCR
jgi:hypothetical protein